MTYLHPSSQKALKAAATRRSQSVIISGAEGSGLLIAANYLTGELDGVTQHVRPIDKKSGKIDMEHGKLLVESVRDLYESTRTKTTKPQVVIIHAAERMTPAAQGAFLKLLEEPHDNLHFILLSHRANKLLPTIRSRASLISLRPITKQQSETLMDELGLAGTTKRAQVQFIASGLPETISRLASDEEYFRQQSQAMKDAKTFLQASTYDKLILINKYRDKRSDAIALINKSLLIMRRMLSAQAPESSIIQIDRLLDAKLALESNANVRLVLAACVV